MNSAGEILATDRSKFDKQEFKEKNRQIDWSVVYQQTDVNSAYGQFEELLLNVINQMAPMRKQQIRNKITPWVSTSTK